jgi:hypothetical protein
MSADLLASECAQYLSTARFQKGFARGVEWLIRGLHDSPKIGSFA